MVKARPPLLDGHLSDSRVALRGKTWLIVAVLYPLRLWIYHKDIHAAVNLSFSFRTPSVDSEVGDVTARHRRLNPPLTTLSGGRALTNSR